MQQYLINKIPGKARFVITGVFFFIFFTAAYAQDVRINGEFNNVTFPQFLQKITSQNSYQFYYKNSELDSFIINTSIININ